MNHLISVLILGLCVCVCHGSLLLKQKLLYLKVSNSDYNDHSLSQTQSAKHPLCVEPFLIATCIPLILHLQKYIYRPTVY